MILPSERMQIEKSKRVANLIEAPDLNYTYPNGLDLRPGKPFHDDLLAELLILAKESADVMVQRHADMAKMEETMRAFIPLDDKEKIAQAKDSRRPVSIVVPITYALYDSMSTQVFASYAANRELHFYEGSGPEDTIGAMLGEKLIALQTARYNELASFATQLRDEMTYGFGVVTLEWTQDVGFTTTRVPRTYIDPLTGETLPDPSGAFDSVSSEGIVFEGNRVRNVDPYCYLPDPNQPIHQPQDGEFVGWLTSFGNRVRLMEKEYTDGYDAEKGTGAYFNCGYVKYLPDGVNRSSIYAESRRDRMGTLWNSGANTHTAPIDVIYLYVQLVPWEWALGDRKTPEKWMFAIAADKVIIAARPLGLRHNKFPVAVVAADTDGYDQCPLGRLETSYGLQQAANFIWNSNMAFTKKALRGNFLVRQEHADMRDVANLANNGSMVRVSRLPLQSPLSTAIEQLKTHPPNPQALQEIMALYDWMQRATGATDSLMGIVKTTGERRSATESRGARNSSLGRIDKYVRLRNAQGMNDLSRMMFSQTAQLLTQPMYIKAIGRWEEELRAEYNVDPSKPWIKVQPGEMDVDVDVVPGDSAATGEDQFQDWVTLYGMITQNPVLAQSIDVLRVFKHIARIGGAKNISDFMTGVPFQGQVMGMEQLQQQVQAGNMVPADGGGMPSAPNRL